jgi:hypothetical protein
MAVCIKCKQASKAIRLLKCSLCFKSVCENCAYRKYGQRFCGEDCAKSFFFGTGEEYESSEA